MNAGKLRAALEAAGVTQRELMAMARRLREADAHVAELWKMPRKAVAAAAALGDGKAQEVLTRMSDNIRTALIALALIAGLAVSGIFAWEGCNAYTTTKGVARMEELKIERELRLKAMQDAQELRQRWVDRCVPPAEAERLVPVQGASSGSGQ